MREKLSCAQCESIRDVELVERDETITMKGREVSFRAVFYRCLSCGQEFELPGMLDKNLEAAREAYARLTQTKSPADLVALRGKYNASQKAFGLLLGFGELTINTYERGGIPTAPNRLLLKLVENPYFFRSVYEENKFRIGAVQRRRIENSEGFVSGSKWNERNTPSDKVHDGFVQVEWLLPMNLVKQVTFTANKLGTTSEEFVSSMLALTTSVIGDSSIPISSMTEKKQECSPGVSSVTAVNATISGLHKAA